MGTKKKVCIGIICLVIIIGIIIVIVKGFNVSLYLRAHQTLEYVFDQTYNMDDVESVCKEVFGNKEYDIRTVEVFNDAVYIISEEITDDELDALVEKLGALYTVQSTSDDAETADETAETSDETSSETEVEETGDSVEFAGGSEIDEENSDSYTFYTDSKIRLRDLLKPYLLPTAISGIIIVICMMIRYKLLKSGSVIKKTIAVLFESAVFLLLLLSIIAIVRIPINEWILPALMFATLIFIIIKFEIETRRKEKAEEK